MQTKKILEALTYVIAAGASVATLCGITSNGGTGTYKHVSIRGDQVLIYGKGLYRHMSAEVAPQGIAQDYVTLFVGVPLLLGALYLYKKRKKGATSLLAGVLSYFLVTYFFYLVMGMYNVLFLLYVVLAGVSFFAVYLLMGQLRTNTSPPRFRHPQRARFAGTFLMATAVLIALLWLSIVVPPLLRGRIFPVQLAHYTTLIVQGLDLAILLPASFMVGWQLQKLLPAGLIWGPVYLVFLSLLMTALTAKVIAMGMLGYPIFPAVFLIPNINLIAVVCTIRLFQSISAQRKKVPAIIA